jgi:hypothetical protein
MPPSPEVSGSAVSNSRVYTGCRDVFKKGRLDWVVDDVVVRYESSVLGSRTTFVPGSMELGRAAVAPPSGPIVTKFGMINPL